MTAVIGAWSFVAHPAICEQDHVCTFSSRARILGGVRVLVPEPSSGKICAVMKTILLVEDDLDILDSLDVYFRAAGYQTERARDGLSALDLFARCEPVLVILDVGLPKLDGFSVLQQLRQRSNVPVLLLTARDSEADEVLGLGLGANDYITKPFSPRVLLARAETALRANKSEVQEWQLAGVHLSLYTMQATYQRQTLPLTPTEFRLLQHLMRSPNRAIARTELLEVALPEGDALERAVDVHLRNLRAKLEVLGALNLIQTVRGIGYRFAGDA
jgi:two-component system, OmpR family, response regulator AdeR